MDIPRHRYLAANHYNADGFWLSTAHAAKFCEVIEKAIGVTPALPSGLALAMDKPKVYSKISSSDGDLSDFLLSL